MSAAELFAAAPPATKPKPALALVVTPNLMRLRHDQLQSSPLNPRKHKPSPEQLEELADSIAARGILQNLVARPLKGSKDKYELAAGETRWRAVGKLIADKRTGAGYLLPVSVRELTDEDVIEIGLVENGRRNDLHPLDEARAFHALYTARMKDGRKAIGDVVNGLAGKIGKSVRYVQKRLAIARNLAPKATEYLEQGAVNVHVATTLATKPIEDQRRFLSSYGKERLSQMTAKEVDEHFRNQWRKMSDALFTHAAYKGPTSELEGVQYATDAKAFDALQKAALEKTRDDYTYLAKKGMIAFFAEGDWFPSYDYDVRKVDGVPDPKGGVFLEWSRYNNKVKVHRGLAKSKQKLAREKSDAAWRARNAQQRSKFVRPKPDPRAPLVAEHCKKTPATIMALELFNALSTVSGPSAINWIGNTYHVWDRDERTLVLDKLKVTKSVERADPKFLAWLLDRSLSELAPAWALLAAHVRDSVVRIATPSKAELVLFDHCGAKLPPTNAKAAGPKRTASKSKPKAKTKKGKK